MLRTILIGILLLVLVGIPILIDILGIALVFMDEMEKEEDIAEKVI